MRIETGSWSGKPNVTHSSNKYQQINQDWSFNVYDLKIYYNWIQKTQTNKNTQIRSQITDDSAWEIISKSTIGSTFKLQSESENHFWKPDTPGQGEVTVESSTSINFPSDKAGKTFLTAPSVLQWSCSVHSNRRLCFVWMNGTLGTTEKEHPCSVDFPRIKGW